ncbi:MAG: arylsulfatase, partial [Proteobacteria bacterium]|nr:arylsulfatase [Pseudomonadota bacterium]
TILEASGAAYPAEYGGHTVQDLDGESFLAALAGKAVTRQQPIAWEHEGNAAVRVGNFKLVRQFGQDWELFDMDADRTELHDLKGKNAPVEATLKHEYDGWAERVGVMDWSVALQRLLRLWQMDDAHG